MITRFETTRTRTWQTARQTDGLTPHRGKNYNKHFCPLVTSFTYIYDFWSLCKLETTAGAIWVMKSHPKSMIARRQSVWSVDSSSNLVARNSQVSHHRPCRGREPCHRLGQGKSGRQRGTATDQMDERGTLDQEDTDVHESGCRILPTQPHMGPGDFQVTCSIKL